MYTNNTQYVIHTYMYVYIYIYIYINKVLWLFIISSVTQSCPTLSDPMDCSMLGFPVHHQLWELAQTQCLLSWWCHLTISSSVVPTPPGFSLSQHQGFSNESAVRIRWSPYWSFSFNISPSNEYSGLISLRMDWLDLLAVQGTLKSLL